MTKRIFTFLRKKQARRITGAKYPAELSGRTAKYYKIKEEKAKSRLQKIFGKKNIKESKARIACQTYKVYDIIRKDMPKTIFIHDPQARVLIRVRLTENAVKAGIVRRSRINTSKVAVPILTEIGRAHV